MTHILIVDTDPVLVLALRDELELGGCTVAVASDCAKALDQAGAQAPDLVLLELELPGMDGLQCCRALRSRSYLRAVPVIFMSACGELAAKLAAYEAGADDYLVKPFALLELNARLRAVLRRSLTPLAEGESAFMLLLPNQPAEAVKPDSHVLQAPGLRLHLDKALVECGARKAHLTPMECEVLNYLLQRRDQIVSSRRMLRELWQYPEGAGDPTAVRWHVKNLRRKIEPDPRHPKRLRTLAHHGYMLVSDLVAD